MHKRKLLSQNFLRNNELAKSLVENSSIGINDLVLEIGPGKGVITEYLLKKSKQVIGIEIDPELCLFLRNKFSSHKNFILYERDVLNFTLPHGSYKVFSNIPFSIEGQIVRKLIDSENPPVDCYLVVVESLAKRLSGFWGDNQFSITHKPWFDFEVVFEFNRFDFTPPPQIETVLWRFHKKQKPMIPWAARCTWTKFIDLGFKDGRPVCQNLSIRYDKTKVQKTISDLVIRKNARPTEISLTTWLSLFHGL